MHYAGRPSAFEDSPQKILGYACASLLPPMLDKWLSFPAASASRAEPWWWRLGVARKPPGLKTNSPERLLQQWGRDAGARRHPVCRRLGITIQNQPQANSSLDPISIIPNTARWWSLEPVRILATRRQRSEVASYFLVRNNSRCP
jgi:hypothetical protein